MNPMNEEKRPDCEIVMQSKFAKWLDNFWYHYKWVTIGIATAVIILIICIAQSCSRENRDIMIVYAGPHSLSVSEQEQLGDLMSMILPGDLDGNGEAVAHLNTYQIYSEAQIKEIESKTDSTGKPLSVDRSFNSNSYKQYSDYMQTGGSSVCFLDPWLYEKMVQSNAVCPLADVFEQMPQGALDEYGVRLGDTELYQTYDLLKLMPEDTVICLVRPYVWGRSSDEKMYQFEVDTFCAIVSFEKEG